MPIFRMDMRKRPRHIGYGDAISDSRVLIDVTWVVVVDETEPHCLSINDPREDEERDTNAGGHDTLITPGQSR